MAIAEDDIERIRSTVALADVVQQYVALRRVGRNWVGLCPFHAEKTGSFNVNDERGRYYCFGCRASGDVFRFVQDVDHVDFVGAVEALANRAGITLTYTSGGESRERQRRKRLVEAMGAAVDWYHERLLSASDARPARDYLRGRGLAGDVAREFTLGWAPEGWDELSTSVGVEPGLLRDAGLAFVNRGGRLQDAFRARVLFPIFTDAGDPVALGGRVLPGSSDPAKYKNSPETAIYAKSKTLYGLNWAKADIVTHDQVVVCEGYTDVIGFHRVGVHHAVATCGTALTEEHVRILKRFANHVVLAFDADSAGLNAAERFYEWEQKYKVEVRVARFAGGQDPGALSQADPDALVAAIGDAEPFLGFRLQRVLSGRATKSPEQRARVADEAMAVVNEHPDRNVRKLYAGQVATQTGLPVNDLVALAERRSPTPHVRIAPLRRIGMQENAEFAVVVMLLQRWDEIAEWLVEDLFADDVHRRAFVALVAVDGHLDKSLAAADPEAREVLERAAVADLDVDPETEARHLIAAAARRELRRGTDVSDPRRVRDDRDAHVQVDLLSRPERAAAAAEWLLGWLGRRRRGAA